MKIGKIVREIRVAACVLWGSFSWTGGSSGEDINEPSSSINGGELD
jgi:hypothetical protein